ncbi:hypothetical protein LOK49_LG02G02156 [Camellia lanceoleosa]|uniref:Uncharacterized protein n=1 Tax=Camellia lanceoleosa TaxID=1840588 RepID=A0ACC0IKV5_9ERIC|nr:hypothetical protein LOK49_LG02G02156 [Camellia lanceoleosa]
MQEDQRIRGFPLLICLGLEYSKIQPMKEPNLVQMQVLPFSAGLSPWFKNQCVRIKLALSLEQSSSTMEYLTQPMKDPNLVQMQVLPFSAGICPWFKNQCVRIKSALSLEQSSSTMEYLTEGTRSFESFSINMYVYVCIYNMHQCGMIDEEGENKFPTEKNKGKQREK